jgi:transcriptional regulator of acetoin/glycerol metabolism
MSDEKLELDRDYSKIRRLDSIIAEQEEAQKAMVERALAAAKKDNPGGPVVYGAALLGISRTRMTRLMKKWGLKR